MIKTLTICAMGLLLAPPSNEQPKSDAAKAPSQAEKSAPAEKSPKAKGAKQLDLLPIEANLIKYTNAQRARYGLKELQVDKELMRSARRHCSWMARSRRLVHTRQPVAENIAMGQPHSSSAVRDWMNSSGHRANILNRRYRRIGVAAYRTQSGTIYWCQQFRG